MSATKRFLAPSVLSRHLPTLNLSHPILQALESHGHDPLRFDQIHAQLLTHGLLHHPLASGRAVLKLCHSGDPRRAISLFSQIDGPDALICNTVIRAALDSCGAAAAFAFYRNQMLRNSIAPNNYTFPILFKVIAELDAVPSGETSHACSVKSGSADDLYVRNSLISMYSRFGNCVAVRAIFRGGVCDPVTWNAVVDGYARNGMVQDARKVFDVMPKRDWISWNTMIGGYALSGDMEAAEELFSAMPQSDVVTWNLMIGGYANLGEVVPARILFDKMPERNVVSWNTMLGLYVRKKEFEECLSLFQWMMVGEVGSRRRVVPNEATLVSVLISSGNLGDLDKGRRIHSYIRDGRWRIQPDVLLYTSLLTMYAKCGDMDSAREVFDTMHERSVVSWNSMIAGYSSFGDGRRALEVFMEMEGSGTVKPNDATFVCMLSACTHAGMVVEGWWVFDRMVHVHRIRPTVAHYGCMVDLLSKAGFLPESKKLVNEAMVSEEHTPPVMGALLSACRTQSNWELGEIIGKRLLEVDTRDTGAYVLLSNIYATQGKWDDVEKVRKLMRERGLAKSAGTSSVGSSKPFSRENGCLKHNRSPVYSMLRDMGTQMKGFCRKL